VNAYEMHLKDKTIQDWGDGDVILPETLEHGQLIMIWEQGKAEGCMACVKGPRQNNEHYVTAVMNINGEWILRCEVPFSNIEDKVAK